MINKVIKFPIIKKVSEGKSITSTMRTPGIIGLSGKWPGKKLSFIVTFFMATADTPGLYSITLSTNKNGNLQPKKNPKKHITETSKRKAKR